MRLNNTLCVYKPFNDTEKYDTKSNDKKKKENNLDLYRGWSAYVKKNQNQCLKD